MVPPSMCETLGGWVGMGGDAGLTVEVCIGSYCDILRKQTYLDLVALLPEYFTTYITV